MSILAQIKKFGRHLVCSTTLLLAATSSYGEESSSIMDAIRNGDTGLLFRLRHENARQDGFRTAKATTLRSQLSFTTGHYHYLRGGVELIDVTTFFGQKYNPTVPTLARPEYAVIKDPKGTGLSLAFLVWDGIEDTDITIGRQYINLDNQRFIGYENFRQYPRSFDAISARTTAIDCLVIYYAYVYKVSTIFGNGRDSSARRGHSTHLANVTWTGFPAGKLTGYTYFVKDKVMHEDSHYMYGLRLAADEIMHDTYGLDYTFEVARQEDRSINMYGFSAWYVRTEVGKNFEDIVNAYFGWEKLSGDAHMPGRQFRTPLGSNHEFLGLADAFVMGIPNRGIQDLFLRLEAHTNTFSLGGAYHVFRFDSSGGVSKTAGYEVDVFLSAMLTENVNLEVVYARFKSKNLSELSSTNRFWASLTASLL